MVTMTAGQLLQCLDGVVAADKPGFRIAGGIDLRSERPELPPGKGWGYNRAHCGCCHEWRQKGLLWGRMDFDYRL